MVAAAAGLPDPDARLLAWTEWLEKFGSAAQRVARDLRSGSPPGQAFDAAVPLAFLDIWIAVLGAARSECDVCPRSRDAAAARRNLGGSCTADLERQLLTELSLCGDSALVELQHEFRGGHREFVLAMLDAGLAPVWAAYPVLARQTTTIVERWIAASEELMQRLAADRSRIASEYNDGRDPGTVDAIDCSVSDPHDGRRRVSIVEFADGLRVVYKPRSMRVEAAFANLVQWLAARGLDSLPPAPRVIERDGYGWMEFVAHGAFASIDEVRRYYRQAGGLILMTHILGSKDLHMENLVASRSGPVLIDAEMLLQPAGDSGDDTVVDRSCLRTGLVSVVEFGADELPYDIGGLRGVRDSREGRVHNAVMLNGEREPPDAYVDDVVDGFTRAYEFVCAHREKLLAADGPLAAFADGLVRVLVRPTNQYALLSSARSAPRYLRDGLVRSMVTDILLRPLNTARTRPRAWPIVVEERQLMEALDVPRFVVPVAGCGVWSQGRLLLDDCYARSPLDAVRERLRDLSAEDCAAQQRVLARALGENTASRLTERMPDDAGDFVAHAAWIGREILAQPPAVNGDAGACGLFLYDGVLGPAILFSALAHVTGEAAWRRAAHDALTPALMWAEAPDGPNGEMTIGGCSGLGSVVYGLACAGAFLNDERALQAATTAAAAITGDRIAADGRFDIVDGAAGAIVGLLALHARTGDAQLLEIAGACAEHLIARREEEPEGWTWPNARGHLVGFAHGAAGIGAALLRLAAATDSRAYRDAGEKALAFVAGAFAPGDASWPVAMRERAEPGATIGRMNAWCHGAPGVAVAALAALDGGRDVEMVAQARSAIGSLSRWDVNHADHLCCGHLGRMDVLLTAGVRLTGAAALDTAREIAARVVARARRQQHFRLSTPGFEYRVHDAGFFRGLSGIGYALLRVAQPARLPSVLAFEAVR